MEIDNIRQILTATRNMATIKTNIQAVWQASRLVNCQCHYKLADFKTAITLLTCTSYKYICSQRLLVLSVHLIVSTCLSLALCY